VIFALERANLDIGIFLLVLLGVFLLLADRRAVLLGYAMFLLAAACKFYPVALLALLGREGHRLVLWGVAIAAVAGVFFLIFFGHSVAVAISILPVGLPFRGIFGAADIPFGLVLLRFMPVWTLFPDAPEYFAGIYHANAIPLIGIGTRILTVCGLVAGIKTAPVYADALARLDEKRRVLLLASAMVMVFCFYLAQNIPYRAIFLLLALPGIWAMVLPRGSAGRIPVFMLYALPLLLWEDCFRNAITTASAALLPPGAAFFPEFAFWLICECIWWWMIIQLTAIAICFLRESLKRLHAGFSGAAA
jgi:hypothetical protein